MKWLFTFSTVFLFLYSHAQDQKSIEDDVYRLFHKISYWWDDNQSSPKTNRSDSLEQANPKKIKQH